MRLQLALNVQDLEEAVTYYTRLFGAEPHKRRPGYANFALDKPPLKLVLVENLHAKERINHLGVEVFKSAELDVTHRRLAVAGILERVEDDTTCCYATQDKVWSAEPQGLSWEWYRITEDEPEKVGRVNVPCGVAEDRQTRTCCN